MEKRISKRIYDLYEIREDPVRNLHKIKPILDELGRFEIEIPEPAELSYYKTSIRRILVPLESFNLLRECLRRFISEQELLEFAEMREFRDYAENFQAKIHNYLESLRNQHELLRFRITEENQQYFEDLLQKLIGIRLEYELIPNLFEKMGYEKNSTTFKINHEVVEVDGRYELKRFSGAKEERLVGKDIVVAECKTTIDLSEIKKFESKIKVIKAKYVKEKENWNYDNLNFKAWMVACYGWSEELLDEARSRGIIPITPTKLEHELKKHEFFDRRIPICPTTESVS